MRRFKLILPLVVLLAALAAEQPKTNFTGNWKLNIEKSDFGALSAPRSSVSKIDHREPALKISTTQAGEQGERTYDLTLSTDGKPAANTLGGNDITSTAKWDGDALLIESKLSLQGNDILIKQKWTLSADGNVLTQSRHLSSAQGETSQKFVLEKQSGK